MQKHLIIADSLDSLNYELDSSIRLARTLFDMGQKIYWAEPKDLFWHSSTAAACLTVTELSFSQSLEPVMPSQSVQGLEAFDAIHMRKDPPFDMHYVMSTILLESAPSAVKQFNSPEGLRSINEKLGILLFAGDCLPSLVSADVERMTEYVLKDCDGDAISKPLDLFGGRGIRRIRSEDRDQIEKILRDETNGSCHMRQLQPFQDSVMQGEVRAFAVGGEPICWAVKKPAEGEFLANTRMGAKVEVYSPSDAELARCSAVAEKLREFGIEVVGFDLIGGLISEINVTSPRMLTPCKKTEETAYGRYAEIIVSLTAGGS